MLQLEDHALARGKSQHRCGDAVPDFFAQQGSFRVGIELLGRLAVEEIGVDAVGFSGCRFRGLILGAARAAAQVVQANVGHHAVEPSVKAALEAEIVQVAVDLEEGVLIEVAGVFGAARQVHRQAQNILVVAAHQFVESGPAARLCRAHQLLLVQCSRGGLARLSVKRQRHFRPKHILTARPPGTHSPGPARSLPIPLDASLWGR